MSHTIATIYGVAPFKADAAAAALSFLDAEVGAEVADAIGHGGSLRRSSVTSLSDEFGGFDNASPRGSLTMPPEGNAAEQPSSLQGSPSILQGSPTAPPAPLPIVGEPEPEGVYSVNEKFELVRCT
jgi:hypothetical protein